jgi:hypothetical protein
MFKLLLIVLVLLTASTVSSAQYARSLDDQLRCKTNPHAGKLLMDMQRSGFIRQTYVVEDTISYFKLYKPVRVLGFSAVAVFGFEEGFEKFFERGPGTLPPEMIGIVVRGTQDGIKLRLRKLGIDNLEVEPHEYDINGHAKVRRSGLVSIACWER